MALRRQLSLDLPFRFYFHDYSSINDMGIQSTGLISFELMIHISHQNGHEKIFIAPKQKVGIMIKRYCLAFPTKLCFANFNQVLDENAEIGDTFTTLQEDLPGAEPPQNEW